MSYCVGDIVTVRRHDCKDGGISAIGVIMKVYDTGTYFIKILNNYSIDQRHRKNWKKYGIQDLSGYYVRREDQVSLYRNTKKTIYNVSGAEVYAEKIEGYSSAGQAIQKCYVKNFQPTRTEVYVCQCRREDPACPQFVMVRSLDVTPGHRGDVLGAEVIIQSSQYQTAKDLVRKACARIQIRQLEDDAR